MKPFVSLTSKIALFPENDVDTDQIIPARFLKVTDKAGLGKLLFHDRRYDADGSEREDFPLARPEARGAQVLVSGANFGCGSSREHAPWALADFGLRAIIARSFADIFRQNALKNGLLPVEVPEEAQRELVEAGSGAEVTIDLETQVVLLPSGSGVSFPIDPFAKRCLLAGTDSLGYLLSFSDKISDFEKEREA